MEPSDTDISRVLERLRDGESPAAEELFTLLYDELRGLASRLFRSQKPHHTLQPTALVNEAYLKLLKSRQEPAKWQDRAHFYRVAARAMRQILVNHARDKARIKRGGRQVGQRITLSEVLSPEIGGEFDILLLHDELEKLAQLDERQGRIAELRFFADLSSKEIAEVLGVSLRTVELDWTMAKSWLAKRLKADAEK